MKTDSENSSKRQSRTNEPNEGDDTEPETCDANGTSVTNGNNGNVAGSTSTEVDGDQEVELIFKPLDYALDKGDAGLMQTRFIKTTMNATVDHLAKYLSMRHLLDAKANSSANPATVAASDGDNLFEQVGNEASLFTIYLAAGPGEFKPLGGQTSLEQISDKYWRANRPLELHYAYKMPTV
jgi:E3 ubiquitin-protein ligase RNF1/2